ncbi:MAG: sugar nucleotide-binding protein, partial [Terriglobales bacterium]
MAADPQPEFLVLGARGQLAQAFLHHLGGRAIGLDRSQLDLGNAAAVERTLARLRPRAVINCAAFNQVDLAETQHQQALAANFAGPAALARGSAAQGWKLLH